MSDPIPLTRQGLEKLGMSVPEVRFEDEIERFAEADRETPPPAGGVLFVGDSDIRRWDAGAFHAAFANLPVLNRGFGGARTWEVLIYFGRIVLPYRPRVIVYCAGDNDIARLARDGVGSAVTGFRLFVERVRAHVPQTRRILYLAIHRSPSDEPLWAFIDQVNAQLRRLCDQTDLAEFVDYLHLLEDSQRRPRANLFMPDALHFTPAFYRDLGAFLRPRIDAVWSAEATG